MTFNLIPAIGLLAGAGAVIALVLLMRRAIRSINYVDHSQVRLVAPIVQPIASPGITWGKSIPVVENQITNIRWPINY